MSFLSGVGKFFKGIGKGVGNLFKKKPGGTLVGNFIRGVSSTASFGLLGSGKGMIPADDGSQVPEWFSGDASGQSGGGVADTIKQILSGNAGGDQKPLIDLSNLIKLPSLSVGANDKTMNVIKLIGFSIAGLIGVKLLMSVIN